MLCLFTRIILKCITEQKLIKHDTNKTVDTNELHNIVDIFGTNVLPYSA